jgi:uncharacterized membrane protein YdjX (TVP38/TMEM64 family)
MQQELLRIINWVAAQEHALAVFVLVYAVATVLGLPGTPFTLGAAILFGFGGGFLAVFVGANVGACLAFLIARYIGRDWVARRLKGRAGLANFDQGVKRSGWRMVLLLRLAPIFPFNALNYALGLSAVSFRNYAAATAIGMLPGIAAYVYVGTLIGDLARIGEARAKSSVEWTVQILGFIATIAAVIYIVRLAKKQLRDTDGGAAEDQPG